MFAAIGRFSYRYRWPVVVVWLVAFAVGLVLTARLSSELKGGGFADPGSPAQQALELMNDKLHTGLSTVSVVFTDPSEGNASAGSSL
ncbi:MAG TPA: hypothetical protein VJ787_02445, partial [Thermoleophilia bacterium]|nr:hypothetical protein [Thermoleophilia bacterium]